jgi:putative flippase GtrA
LRILAFHQAEGLDETQESATGCLQNMAEFRNDAGRQALMMQVVRYGIVGLGVTAAQAATYWTLATLTYWHSQLANIAGYLVAVTLGYFLHGAVTFRDAGRPDGAGAKAARTVRFIAVSLVSLALNALWVWLCVSAARWPTWTPIPLMLFITPAFVFILNKRWVFR